jgi:hypothetical protein
MSTAPNRDGTNQPSARRRRWTWLARDDLALEWIIIPATIVVVFIVGFGLKFLL